MWVMRDRILLKKNSQQAAARGSHEHQSMPTPVLIVCGYAAAGKTHLVNLLLRACEVHGKKAGVIVHRQAEEFGIEPHTVDAQRACLVETIYDFGSGCICCSPRGDLTR